MPTDANGCTVTCGELLCNDGSDDCDVREAAEEAAQAAANAKAAEEAEEAAAAAQAAADAKAT